MRAIAVVVLASGLVQPAWAQPPADSGGAPADDGSQRAAQSTAPRPHSAPTWTRLTAEAQFSPRDTAEDLVFAGKMWLSNGFYHGNVLTRDLWCSTTGADWTRVSAQTPYDGYSELVAYAGKVWAIKGSVWSSADGVAWQRVAERTPFGVRSYGEAIVFRDQIWQLGSGDDVWRTADGVHWTCAVRAAPFGNRTAAAVVVFAGKLWLLGGATPGANDPPEKGYPNLTTHNDVWCSEDGEQWTRVVEHAPWAPRKWFIAKVYRKRMWIIGGYDNVNSANFGDVWYTANGQAWHALTATAVFSPRHEPTCYVYDNSLWVVAGNAWPVQNDVWKLTLPPAGANTTSAPSGAH